MNIFFFSIFLFIEYKLIFYISNNLNIREMFFDYYFQIIMILNKQNVFLITYLLPSLPYLLFIKKNE